MTQQSEKNKAIAEFMGWRFVIDDDKTVTAYFNGERRWIDDEQFLSQLLSSASGFAFHCDWNKLMSVWLKIRSKIWQENNGSYPVEFLNISESFKRECFNGTIETAQEVIMQAITYHNSINKTTHKL